LNDAGTVPLYVGDIATFTVALSWSAVPLPALLWHGPQKPVTPGMALCLVWEPAVFGVDVPVGGDAWQEVQFVRVRGDPAVWQVVHAGPVPPFSDAPWQRAHALAMFPALWWLVG
jgi:hypothetical protein